MTYPTREEILRQIAYNNHQAALANAANIVLYGELHAIDAGEQPHALTEIAERIKERQEAGR